MENASKALIMAGSILMSLIIIGLLVFMVGNLSELEQIKTDSEEIQKLVDYNEKFEQFNKTIYGSEILSLANLQEDYNIKEGNEKGYQPITITVTINRGIDTRYFPRGNNINIDTIRGYKNDLESQIREYEEYNLARRAGKLYKDRVVKYYAQIRNREIADIYGITYSSYEIDYDIGERLKTISSVRNLMNDIDTYRNVKSIYTEFKNKKFRCSTIQYDEQNARITTMRFTEV